MPVSLYPPALHGSFRTNNRQSTDIFVQNVPASYTTFQLNDIIRPLCLSLNVNIFRCRVMNGKPLKNALINFATQEDASAILSVANTQLSSLRFSFSNRPVNTTLLNCLLNEKANLAEKSDANSESSRSQHRTQIPFNSLQCGMFDYSNGALCFVPYTDDKRTGSFHIGHKRATVILKGSIHNRRVSRMDFDFQMLDSVCSTGVYPLTVYFSLLQSPIIYDLEKIPEASDDLSALFSGLNLSIFESRQHNPSNTVLVDGKRYSRSRTSGLDAAHESVAGVCTVYAFILSTLEDLEHLKKALIQEREAPKPQMLTIHKPTSLRDYAAEKRVLQDTLAKMIQMGKMHYLVAFQVLRLVYNAYLSPIKVLSLIPKICEACQTFDRICMLEGIRYLARCLPIPGPMNEPAQFGRERLMELVVEGARNFVIAGSLYDKVRWTEYLAMVLKVIITPCGIYLEGPELETKNRVLRKYPGHAEYFLRVTFADENWEKLNFESGVNRRNIFGVRFSRAINSSIPIAGRNHVFLGFSHSSLRAAQCWFMAPFTQDGTLMIASMVIQQLGDFTNFKSPSRCAARIGQAFSDATDTVKLPYADTRIVDDVKRNGHCFTDGVGKISPALLSEIRQTLYRRSSRRPPTVFQIRYQGAKGMLALDHNMKDSHIKAVFRPSMIKFEGSLDESLEITGGGYKKLPMYLNSQLIKILEDLGVPYESFAKLQQDALDKIFCMIESPESAANFMLDNFFGTAVSLSELIRLLCDYRQDYRQDPFLQSCVKIAALVRLRELKYKARIPVEKAHTLLGVTDEFECLKEGEIYVTTKGSNGHREVLIGRVFITRQPALHPGDVQKATAVDVPKDHPLTKLHNCVVFSQQGSRDLPSQLSGGDLDGDLFNIIADPTLFPTSTTDAAKYPPANPRVIDRPVRIEDMTNFFLEFLETDQLGHISSTHLMLSDQEPRGTFHEDCIKIAELASIAVDYSKTGVAVDMREMPRVNAKCKPDFMARAPHMLYDQDTLGIDVGPDPNPDPNAATDTTEYLDPDVEKVRYYRSTKALGRLYRNVDESKFSQEFKEASKTGDGQSPYPNGMQTDTLVHNIFSKILYETYGFLWDQYISEAIDIRKSYETAVVEFAFTYSNDNKKPLFEIEVFTGTILGRAGGAPSKRDKDKNIDMRREFEDRCRMITDWILNGDYSPQYEQEQSEDATSRITIPGIDGHTELAPRPNEDQLQPGDLANWESENFEKEEDMGPEYGAHEALPRATAALYVSLQPGMGINAVRGFGEVKSFKYLAAVVALMALRKTQS